VFRLSQWPFHSRWPMSVQEQQQLEQQLLAQYHDPNVARSTVRSQTNIIYGWQQLRLWGCKHPRRACCVAAAETQ
jgi:hypothetical protein